MSDVEKINNIKNQLDTIEEDAFIIYRALKDALDLYDFRYKYSIELLNEKESFKAQIKDRIEELKNDLREETNHNQNHIASMISGEIDGLQWVLDLFENKENK